MLRFHLDEHVAGAVAKGLRMRGIDVTTAAEVGLLSAPDDEHLRFALTTGRVIVTHDDDFLKLSDAGSPHAGIAYCHAETRTIGEIVRHLDLMADCLSPNEMVRQVEFI